jgi:nucleotide-binding universal stress UspA family protein
MTKPTRILAAVDFSDRSRVALALAARLACRFDAELRVMHAQEPLLAAAAESRGIDLTSETEDELRAIVANTGRHRNAAYTSTLWSARHRLASPRRPNTSLRTSS